MVKAIHPEIKIGCRTFQSLWLKIFASQETHSSSSMVVFNTLIWNMSEKHAPTCSSSMAKMPHRQPMTHWWLLRFVMQIFEVHNGEMQRSQSFQQNWWVEVRMLKMLERWYQKSKWLQISRSKSRTIWVCNTFINRRGKDSLGWQNGEIWWVGAPLINSPFSTHLKFVINWCTIYMVTR